MKKQFRTAYDPPKRVQSVQGGLSKTRQAHKNECDVNVIMSRYRQTGLITHINKHQGQYIDVPDGLEFGAAMSILVDATESFELLPAEVRDHYRNDPARFLDAVTTGRDVEILREFNILPKSPSPAKDSPDPSPEPAPDNGSGAG